MPEHVVMGVGYFARRALVTDIIWPVYEFDDAWDESKHPRDEAGRFAETGFNGEKLPPKPDPVTWNVKDHGDTQDRYSRIGADGKREWTAARQAIAAAVAKRETTDPIDAKTGEHLGRPPVSDDPTIFMMGGGAASGKTTILESGMLVDVPPRGAGTDDRPGAVYSEADVYKTELSEYQAMVKAGNIEHAAGVVHEESSKISKDVIAEAMKNRQNIVYDTIGDGTPEALAAKVAGWKAAGYKVAANYVVVDPEVAVSRAEERAKATGRNVVTDVVRQSHLSVARIIANLPKIGFDRVKVIESLPGNQPPKFIANYQAGRGAGSGLHIVDAPAWRTELLRAQ